MNRLEVLGLWFVLFVPPDTIFDALLHIVNRLVTQPLPGFLYREGSLRGDPSNGMAAQELGCSLPQGEYPVQPLRGYGKTEHEPGWNNLDRFLRGLVSGRTPDLARKVPKEDRPAISDEKGFSVNLWGLWILCTSQ